MLAKFVVPLVVVVGVVVSMRSPVAADGYDSLKKIENFAVVNEVNSLVSRGHLMRRMDLYQALGMVLADSYFRHSDNSLGPDPWASLLEQRVLKPCQEIVKECGEVNSLDCNQVSQLCREIAKRSDLKDDNEWFDKELERLYRAAI